MLTDAHIHLQDHRFDSDRPFLIEEALKNNVSTFFCAATSSEDWEKTLKLKEDGATIIPFIGTHPWYTPAHDIDQLKELLIRFPFSGVGEIGLDALKKTEKQETVFLEQLFLAASLKRPCIIHCVRAYERLLPLLRNRELPPSMLFHAFAGMENEMIFLSERGGYFSFSGSSLYTNRTRTHEIIKKVPLDRLLIETDAPDMKPPSDYCINPEEKRNVPANLPLILKGIASLRKMDEAELGRITAENAQRVIKELKNEQ